MVLPMRLSCLIMVAWLVGLPLAAAGEPADVAAQADKLLRTEVPLAGSVPARVSDEIFLRRASLDVVGRVPTPGQISAFVLDPSPTKRDQVVQYLLADSRYGENWGRYWRDVIMYRKTEERAGIIAGPLEDYLVASFNDNKPWSQVATDFPNTPSAFVLRNTTSDRDGVLMPALAARSPRPICVPPPTCTSSSSDNGSSQWCVRSITSVLNARNRTLSAGNSAKIAATSAL